jgi:hypothetical protein
MTEPTQAQAQMDELRQRVEALEAQRAESTDAGTDDDTDAQGAGSDADAGLAGGVGQEGGA